MLGKTILVENNYYVKDENHIKRLPGAKQIARKTLTTMVKRLKIPFSCKLGRYLSVVRQEDELKLRT